LANVTSANAQLVNLTATSGTITNLTSGSAQISSASVTNGTVTNLTSSNARVTNAAITNATISNVTAANAQVSNLNAVNGTIQNLSVNAVTTGTVSAAAATMANVTSGNATVTNSLSVRQGANVDMGGNRIQNVGNGVNDSDAANMGQLRQVEKLANQQGRDCCCGCQHPDSTCADARANHDWCRSWQFGWTDCGGRRLGCAHHRGSGAEKARSACRVAPPQWASASVTPSSNAFSGKGPFAAPFPSGTPS
jgi:hypothetical protein